MCTAVLQLREEKSFRVFVVFDVLGGTGYGEQWLSSENE